MIAIRIHAHFDVTAAVGHFGLLRPVGGDQTATGHSQFEPPKCAIWVAHDDETDAILFHPLHHAITTEAARPVERAIDLRTCRGGCSACFLGIVTPAEQQGRDRSQASQSHGFVTWLTSRTAPFAALVVMAA